MALETATYINQLVTSNPAGSDPLAAADDHLRLIKSTLKNTFANITGAVTATQAMLNNPFPVGGIIMWSGATGTIPSGWLLCDGNNDTPDLRDKFIIGAGSTFSVGGTGGSTTISAANLPAHTHSFSGTSDAGGGHTHTITDPGHKHTGVNVGAAKYYTSDNLPGTSNMVGMGDNTTNYTGTATTGITINAAADHTHTFSGTTNSTGSGTAYYPPYYALAFIMKSAYA